MYKLYKTLGNNISNAVIKFNEGGSMTSFIFDPANTDYQAFKQDIAEGKVLQDADGNEMTAEAAQEYVRNLP